MTHVTAGVSKSLGGGGRTSGTVPNQNTVLCRQHEWSVSPSHITRPGGECTNKREGGLVREPTNHFTIQ
jgi:hypothetical protein